MTQLVTPDNYAPGDELDRNIEERLHYEENLYNFLRGAWPYICAQEFVPGWHLEAIAEHLEAVTRGQLRHLLINIPPRLTKSLLVSVAWQAWVWAQLPNVAPLAGPNIQFLTTSYALPLALRDSVRTRRLIDSPWYQRLWGSRFAMLGDTNTKGRYENTKGGYRLATSVGGGLTGEGGNIITFDDPHNVIEIESEAKIEEIVMWWDEAMPSRLNRPDTDVYVGVMQRISERDLSGHILAQHDPEWTHLCLPMEYERDYHCITALPWEDPRTEEGEILVPERYSPKSLAALKRKLGPYGAAGQLQQHPVPRGGGIIKSTWWKVWPPHGEQFTADGRPLKPLHYPEVDFVIASVDTAMETKQENDYSAMTVWGVWRTQQDMPAIILMDAWNERLEFHALVEKVILMCRTRKVDRVLVEGKNTGIAVVQEMQRLCAGESFAVFKEPVQGDKVARAHSIVNMFAAGMVWAPDRRWAQAVIDQCASFPKGEHDDMVDTVTQVLRHLRRVGALQMPEERTEVLRKRLGPYAEAHREPAYDA